MEPCTAQSMLASWRSRGAGEQDQDIKVVYQRNIPPGQLQHSLLERRSSEPASPSKARRKQEARQISYVRRRLQLVEGEGNVHGEELMETGVRVRSRRASGGDERWRGEEPVKCIEALRASKQWIEDRLAASRSEASRPEDLELCSLDQILQEKQELQSALLEHERRHGHPESREEREEMQDVYERYRSIKRLARRSSSSLTPSELLPIPELEAVALTLASPSHR